MSSVKLPMSTSYKAVFILSIVMIFVVIIGGAMSGSKTTGFGIWYWGYTAWKMYKRDNKSLVSIQKIMLWFEAISFSIALGVLLFSDSNVRRYVDVTPIGLLIIASLTMGLTYFLYKFFLDQSKLETGPSIATNSSSIEDQHWEQASRELEGVRHEATWAKVLATVEGDESKAKALYLKFRAAYFQSSQSSNAQHTTSTHNTPNVDVAKSMLFWSSFNSVGKLAIIAIVLLIGYAFFHSFFQKNSSSESSDSAKSATSSVPSSPSNKVPSVPSIDKTIKSIDEVKNLCYVYWDGVRWQLGRTEGDNFARFSRDKYGIDLVEFAIPRQMANEFSISNKVGEKINNRRFDDFISSYWYQVESVCKFN